MSCGHQVDREVRVGFREMKRMLRESTKDNGPAAAVGCVVILRSSGIRSV